MVFGNGMFFKNFVKITFFGEGNPSEVLKLSAVAVISVLMRQRFCVLY